MYSDDINKICEVCVFSGAVKGSATHLTCSAWGGYVSKSHTCPQFKYDILKKKVRRRPSVNTAFSPEDFAL